VRQAGDHPAGRAVEPVLDRLAADLLENGGTRGPLSKATVHSYLRPINHMLRWAAEEGEIGNVKVQLPRLPKVLIEVLTRDEIDRMEDAAKSERDKFVIRMLADTGIRVGELVSLFLLTSFVTWTLLSGEHASLPTWMVVVPAVISVYGFIVGL
jgi:integrase